MKFKVWVNDYLGNDKDGYEFNNRYDYGEIEVNIAEDDPRFEEQVKEKLRLLRTFFLTKIFAGWVYELKLEWIDDGVYQLNDEALTPVITLEKQ